VEEFHAFEANPNTLPDELINVARPLGRDSSVQIVQHKTRPLYGVQFHPEGFAGANAQAVAVGAEMVRTFTAICKNVRGSVRPAYAETSSAKIR
ncbi:MAG: hypothetical protein Q8P02_00500, partial [Candidatus Micrarchaeota archaeon]|nr:hypothetical protein [Candidatus Micrarchaeota archaeon]